MEGLKEFLESSTIHGLTYISTSNRIIVKSFWIFIVSFGFATGSYLIYQSFHEWHEDPVGTTEKTLPIDISIFPRIVICPPKGTRTALNKYLKLSENAKLSEEKKKGFAGTC